MKPLIPYIETYGEDTETPITMYEKYVGQQVGFLLESREYPKGRYSIMAANPHSIIKAQKQVVTIYEGDKKRTVNRKPLLVVKEMLERSLVHNSTQLPFIGGAVGYVGYDAIRYYEHLPDTNKDTINIPDICLMFVRESVVYDHFHHQIHIVVLEEADDGGKNRADSKIQFIKKKLQRKIEIKTVNEQSKVVFKSNTSKEAFVDAVNRAKQYIYDGDIFQVVLSQRWSGHSDRSSFELYRKLRQVNPSPYLYYFNYCNFHICGSSPEMLVELKNNKITNCPIAGTRPRGKNTKEDDRMSADLLQDEKEKAEHNMLVDLGRNDMGKVAKIGTVQVDDYMNVHYYSHVMHLFSKVIGEKKEGIDRFDVLMSFLPAGTLSGAPKIRAMEIIDELEIHKRGLYGGAIGYFGLDGNMDMCIAIRTMLIKDHQIYLQAGAGIVYDSDPEKEYEECFNKAKGLMTAINQE